MTTTPTRTAAAQSDSLSALVAEEIRAMMARKRISGARLARALDVSPAWVSYRLTGVQPIDLNDLAAIARVLEVSVLSLIPDKAVDAPLDLNIGSDSRRGTRRTNGGRGRRDRRTSRRSGQIDRRPVSTPPPNRRRPVATRTITSG